MYESLPPQLARLRAATPLMVAFLTSHSMKIRIRRKGTCRLSDKKGFSCRKNGIYIINKRAGTVYVHLPKTGQSPLCSASGVRGLPYGGFSRLGTAGLTLREHKRLYAGSDRDPVNHALRFRGKFRPYNFYGCTPLGFRFQYGIAGGMVRHRYEHVAGIGERLLERNFDKHGFIVHGEPEWSGSELLQRSPRPSGCLHRCEIELA
jgi:hypothetical protein